MISWNSMIHAENHEKIHGFCFHSSFLHIFGPPRPECRNSEKGNGMPMIPEPEIMKISIFMEIPEFS